MRSSRDEFRQPVKDELARRVGFRCSNPNCRIGTSGPHTEEAKSVSVGVAAHISAAAPGGKRFDATLTHHERRAFANGIWLCERCAKLIDTDEERYRVALLRSWKERAEAAALAELEGREPRDDPDAHSIRFAVNDWNVWRNRGNLPGDQVVIVSGWARGDIRFSFTSRLRNDNPWEDQLHSVRLEYCRKRASLLVDCYAIQPDEIVLPSQKWVSLRVSHGCHNSDQEAVSDADSIWLTALTVGDDLPLAWKVADINFPSVQQEN